MDSHSGQMAQVICLITFTVRRPVVHPKTCRGPEKIALSIDSNVLSDLHEELHDVDGDVIETSFLSIGLITCSHQ